MPVLITGATGLVGRALAQRLLATGGQVRAYLRRDDPELRAAGVHIALGSMDQIERLESALTRVHTIVHLVGGIKPERGVTCDWLNRDTTETAVIAARAADVKRFLFLSAPGADPHAKNEFLAAKGKAERHIVESGLEYAILRCPPIREGLVRVTGVLRRRPRVNPVQLDEVVSALVAADERDAPVRGIWTLGETAGATYP